MGCESGLAQHAIEKSAASQLHIIRAGDRLIVQEHTSFVDLELEGVALASAARGSALNVRLGVGGKTVRAMAVQPGIAWLMPVTELMQ
jgi:hypothetical protein